jgi:hypothetical protein
MNIPEFFYKLPVIPDIEIEFSYATARRVEPEENRVITGHLAKWFESIPKQTCQYLFRLDERIGAH